MTAPNRPVKSSETDAVRSGPALARTEGTVHASPLEAALSYAARGWHVCPLNCLTDDGCSCGNADCGNPGKHPIGRLVPHGLKDATTDEAKIRSWWSARPSANVAVATGEASGVWMLGPDGQQGIDDLADLERSHGPLPRTPTIRSGGGGRHFYFLYPVGRMVKNAINAHGKKIDVRGEGGYAVAPPSNHKSGACYEWEVSPAGCDVAEAPPWLLDWLDGPREKRQATPRANPAPSRTVDHEALYGRARKYIERCPGAVSGCGGHGQTMSVCRAVCYGYGMGEQEGFDFIAAEYNPKCDPPWPDADLRHKCKDAVNTPDPAGRPFGYLRDAEREGYRRSWRREQYDHAPAEDPSGGQVEDDAPPPESDLPRMQDDVEDAVGALTALAGTDAQAAIDAAMLDGNFGFLVTARSRNLLALEHFYRSLEKNKAGARAIDRLRTAVNRKAKEEKRREPCREDRGPRDDEAPPVTFSNYREEEEFAGDDGKPRVVKLGLPAPAVARHLLDLTGGWPKSAGGILSVESAVCTPKYLTQPTKLFGWVQNVLPCGDRNAVRWAEGEDKVTQATFHAAIPTLVDQFDAVEPFPHHPPLEGHYYMHPELPRGDGRALRCLVDRFAPETPIDRDLITAFFLSLFWGGPHGQRPAWLFTNTPKEKDGGIGIGKSTVPQMAALLLRGSINLREGEKMTDLVERMLGDEALPMRMLFLDNLKSLKFSWGDLESVITASRITGHKMYHGETSRPNTLTTVLTLNGAALSRDMAQRCIPVQMARPPYSLTWREEIQSFIEANRWGIVADCVARLRSPGGSLHGASRWGAWEAGVLSRVAEPSDCQLVIRERQGAIDADSAEADIVRQYFAGRLRGRGYDPQSCCVFIPSPTVGEWLWEATKERRGTAKAGAFLNQLNVKGLYRDTFRNTRGFTWKGGENAGGDEPEWLRD